MNSSVSNTVQRITSIIQNHIEFIILHLNIRSLNAKYRGLCQFLALLNLQFDVIVLSDMGY